MKLEKLIEYTSDQEHKINRLIGRTGCFVGFTGNINYTHPWVKFRDFLWGNVRALEPLEGEVEGDGTIVEIPGTIPSGLFLESSHILVRSEYEEAGQAALAANADNFDAFLVGGQSGIGPPLSSSSSAELHL